MAENTWATGGYFTPISGGTTVRKSLGPCSKNVKHSFLCIISYLYLHLSRCHRNSRQCETDVHSPLWLDHRVKRVYESANCDLIRDLKQELLNMPSISCTMTCRPITLLDRTCWRFLRYQICQQFNPRPITHNPRDLSIRHCCNATAPPLGVKKLKKNSNERETTNELWKNSIGCQTDYVTM